MPREAGLGIDVNENVIEKYPWVPDRGPISMSNRRGRPWQWWETILFRGETAELITTELTMTGTIAAGDPERYRYLNILINIFVVVLIVSNLIAPKFVAVGWFRFSAAELLFPITYIFGDVFTEVYGYSASRKAIWTGFLGSVIMTAFGMFAIWLPAAPEFKNQQAFETIFGVIPRNVAGSLIAYCAGEFANSLTVAKMKLWTDGKYLWTRTMGSTVVGQLVDTSISWCSSFSGVSRWV